jgi:hypothetical protein
VHLESLCPGILQDATCPPVFYYWRQPLARQGLTIGVVSSTGAPCQDVVGVGLHCSTAVAVLTFIQPSRVDIGMSALCDCDFWERMDGGAGEQEQVSGLGGGGAHGV